MRAGAVLALDQGGQSSRAILFDAATGAVAAAAARPVATRHDPSNPSRIEQDPEELVRSLEEALTEVLAHAEAAGPCPPLAAALATQRSSLLFWERASGRPLTPVLSWQDTRGAALLERCLPDATARAAVRARTGLFPSAHHGASKLRWCLEADPALLRAVERGVAVGGPLASFLAQRLTGGDAPGVDPANASRTLLWNMTTHAWDPELCDVFGVPAVLLPACRPTRTAQGSLRLAPHVPLVVVTGDQAAALCVRGWPVSGEVLINLGTGAFLQRACTPAPPRLLESVAFADAHKTVRVSEGTVHGAGAALAWWRAVSGLGDALDLQLPSWLESAADPPLFRNTIGGLGSPYWQSGPDPVFRPAVVFPLGTTDLVACSVAVIESIAFLIVRNLEELSRVGVDPHVLVVSGGLNRLDGLCRRLASLAGCPVQRLHDPEATARGAAWLAAGEPAWRVPPGEEIAPQPDARLRQRYTAWRSWMECC